MIGNTIITAEELARQLGNHPKLRILDARFSLSTGNVAANTPNPGLIAWQMAHLPNAAYVDLDKDLSDKSKPAAMGRHPLPDAGVFCKTLERCGVTKDSEVVIYDANDGAMAAARAWWLMRMLGHQQVAVLDGGFARWTELDFPVDNQISAIDTSIYHAEYDQSQIMQTEAIHSNIHTKQYVLFDARAAERYRGEIEPMDKAAGHIPGALNRPYSLNMANGCFRPADQLRKDFLALLGNKKSSDAILYCGSGVTACHNFLAMEIAGLSGAKLFPPSWSGWIADADHQIALGNHPGDTP
jgi:thiosulfate/3-mercaptopyruvate sulfurtransferase